MKRRWTEAELAILREHYPNERGQDVAARLGRSVSTVHQMAVKLKLGKSDAFKASDLSGRVSRGKQHPSMIATRFKAGQPSWSKGTKGVVGVQEGCRRTQFKKGEMAGAAQHNYVPLGSLRVSKDGYLERKVTDDPSLVPARRWVAVHRLVWMEANGEVPAGHVVVFKPGRRTTVVEKIALDGLELVSRVELMQRNTLHRYPKEVAELIQLKGAIKRQVSRIAKEST